MQSRYFCRHGRHTARYVVAGHCAHRHDTFYRQHSLANEWAMEFLTSSPCLEGQGIPTLTSGAYCFVGTCAVRVSPCRVLPPLHSRYAASPAVWSQSVGHRPRGFCDRQKKERVQCVFLRKETMSLATCTHSSVVPCPVQTV